MKSAFPCGQGISINKGKLAVPKEISVHIDLKGKPYFVGRLWVHERHGRENATFEYAKEWLTSPLRFPIEPLLSMGEGKYHTPKALFGSMGDSAPDRWGRVLLDRMEARTAVWEGRRARKLQESDYLLKVNDLARQGALRFSQGSGPFLAVQSDYSIPPLMHLGKLLSASNRVLTNSEKDQDLKDITQPGSSLGGARPKAVVFDNQNHLLIAKFPSPQDEWDVELWEFLSLRLAGKAGIPVPPFQMVRVAGQTVLLLHRFDRRAQGVRVPFLSAMSMLGAEDGEKGRSYVEIADVLVEYGSKPTQDLKDLWRRIVFNIMISNVDDHLRNHGFLYDGMSGWRLSPLYDLEPTPAHKKARMLQTNIVRYNNAASLDLALEVIDTFGLKLAEAKKIANRVALSVKDWHNEASRCGISRHEIEMMRSAFEHEITVQKHF